MEWSPHDAMEAYLQTLHYSKVQRKHVDVQPESAGVVDDEPKCMEFMSALAAGKRAKLMVEITTQGITPLTVALGVAAKQSGGQLICINVLVDGSDDSLIKPTGEAHDDEKQLVGTDLGRVIKLVHGSPWEMIMQLKNIDFAVIDCNFDDFLRLSTKLDVNPTASTVIVHNLHHKSSKGRSVSFAQVVKRSKGVHSVTYVPIGEGIGLTRRIGSSSSTIKPSRIRRQYKYKRFHVTFHNY